MNILNKGAYWQSVYVEYKIGFVLCVFGFINLELGGLEKWPAPVGGSIQEV